MHAGVLLLLWFAVVAGLQLLDGAPLLWAALCSLLLAFALAPGRTRSLLRRIVVLMLAILVLFGWFTPGEALLTDWPRLAPSREGLLLALVHWGRLVAVVCAVSLLLEKLSYPRLVAGLYSLSRPLAWTGLQPAQFALRLMLVLQLVDGKPRARLRRWQDWLEHEDEQQTWPVLQLQPERLGRFDLLLLALVLIALVTAWMVR